MKWILSFFITLAIFCLGKWAIISETESLLRVIKSGANNLEIAWEAIYPLIFINFVIQAIVTMTYIHLVNDKYEPYSDILTPFICANVLYFLSVYLSFKFGETNGITKFITLIGLVFNVIQIRNSLPVKYGQGNY